MNEPLLPAETPRSLSLAPLHTRAIGTRRDSMGSFPRNGRTEESEGVPWTRYIEALKRHLILIVVMTAMGALGGAYIARGVDDSFDVSAKIWINTISPQNVQNAPIQAQTLLPSNSWVDLVRTFAILDPVVSRLRLHVWYR